jgi:hypothetical protein
MEEAYEKIEGNELEKWKMSRSSSVLVISPQLSPKLMQIFRRKTFDYPRPLLYRHANSLFIATNPKISCHRNGVGHENCTSLSFITTPKSDNFPCSVDSMELLQLLPGILKKFMT